MQNDLISRSALKKTFEDAELGEHSLIESVLAAGVYAGIDNAPAIDAVPVVRCKDCKNRGTSYDCPFRQLVFTEAEGYHYEDVTLDDSFCSFGERKEDAPCG